MALGDGGVSYLMVGTNHSTASGFALNGLKVFELENYLIETKLELYYADKGGLLVVEAFDEKSIVQGGDLAAYI